MLVNQNEVDALRCQANFADSQDAQHAYDMRADDMQDILDLQDRIDVLKSEREACQWSGKMRIDRTIERLEAEVSELFEYMPAMPVECECCGRTTELSEDTNGVVCVPCRLNHAAHWTTK